jgi:hypothetical protein
VNNYDVKSLSPIPTLSSRLDVSSTASRVRKTLDYIKYPERMPDSVIDLRQFILYLKRNTNDFLESDLIEALERYNDSTSFYRKMMRFFEDRNMMDVENFKVTNVHYKHFMSYWTHIFKSKAFDRVKFVGQIRSKGTNIGKKFSFMLKTSESMNRRSDKYIRGEKLKYRLVNNRSRKVLLKGPSIEGDSCKIRTQYIADYSCLNLTFMNHKMNQVVSYNLVTRT